jgi:hypothetical protein
MGDEKVQPITLQISNTVVRVDGFWLRHYAGDFLAAAKYFRPPDNRFSPVPYYLICHSIELSLKSFLFTAGFRKADRRRLNHDLEKALQAAENNGLSTHIQLTADERGLLCKANRLYPKKEFEYFKSLETIYDPHDFELDALASLARKLFEAIETPVRGSIFE